MLDDPPTEMRKARVGADEVNRLLTARPDDVGVLLEHRDCGAHAWQARDLLEQRLVEAATVAGCELKAHLADDPARQPLHGAVEARVGDLRGEQQRDTDRDPEHGEQFLRQASSQAHAIQAHDARQPHRASPALVSACIDGSTRLLHPG